MALDSRLRRWGSSCASPARRPGCSPAPRQLAPATNTSTASPIRACRRGTAPSQPAPSRASSVPSWLGQIALARYVVQWNAMAEASTARTRTATTANVRSLAARRSKSRLGSGARAHQLQRRSIQLRRANIEREPRTVLADWPIRAERADRLRRAVERAEQPGPGARRKPAEIADWAEPDLCTAQLPADRGRLRRRLVATSYAQAYISALSFSPAIWGIHPYHAVKAHNDASVLELEQALPSRRRGRSHLVHRDRGLLLRCAATCAAKRSRQATRPYLVNDLIPAIVPTHVFYYGFMAGDDTRSTVRRGGVSDSELYQRLG